MATALGKTSTEYALRLRGRILGLMGEALGRQGDFDLALGRLKERLALCEDLLDWDSVAQAHMQMGHAYLLLNNAVQASDQYRKALVVSRQYGLRERIGESLNHIASICYFQKDLDQAMEYFHAALSELRDQGASPLLGQTLMQIANIYRKEGASKKAEKYYAEAEKVLKTVGDEYVLGMTLANRALLAFAQEDEERGLDLIRESFDRLFYAGAESEIHLFKATLETVYGIKKLPA